MSEYLIQGDTLTGIADAIREKTGGTLPILASDMAAEISKITTGLDSSAEDGLITGMLTEYENSRVTRIGDRALEYRPKLTSVSFPSVTDIGNFAFCYGTGLTNVNIPLAKTIRNSAFNTCNKLTDADFPNTTTIGQNAFYMCAQLVNTNFPSVTTIGATAFAACGKLTKLDFPSVTSIMTSAFSNCSLLETLIIRSDSVCTLSNTNALASTPIAKGTGYIYVPSALVNSYKSATNWSAYADQIRAIEDYPDITGGSST